MASSAQALTCGSDLTAHRLRLRPTSPNPIPPCPNLQRIKLRPQEHAVVSTYGAKRPLRGDRKGPLRCSLLLPPEKHSLTLRMLTKEIQRGQRVAAK